jgi:hypothetical protein
MIKKPKPIFDLNERDQRFFDQLCDHLDATILEPIDGIMLSIMATQMGILSIALSQANEIMDLAQDGSMNFTPIFSTVKDLYASLIDYADRYYMNTKDVDKLLEDCDIIFPPAFKRLLDE